jgi:anti-sigma factor RsiW
LVDSCPDTELLAAYVDENVTEKERRLIDAHLVDCERCLDVVAFVIASKVAIPDPMPPSTGSA